MYHIDEDLDVMGAMCINDRGFYNPAGSEKPSNCQNCFAYFEKRLDWDQVRPLMIKKLFNYRRFECIGVIDPKSRMFKKSRNVSNKVWNTEWIKCDMTDPAIINQLLQCHQVSSNDELYTLIDKLCNVKLVGYLPQWRVHYIDNLDGMSCWVWRVSHGIADGLRLVTLCSELFEDIDGNPINPPRSGKLTADKTRINLSNSYLSYDDAKLFYNDSNAFVETKLKERLHKNKPSNKKNGDNEDKDKNKNKKNVKTKSNNVVGKYLGLVRKIIDPRNIIKVFKDIKSVNDMLKGPFDTVSPFKPDYTIHCPPKQKTFRPSIERCNGKDYISLEYVKKIKNHYGASVNDVLTALVAGAIRAYIESQKPDYFKNRNMAKYRV